VTGVEQLAFVDILRWWEAHFHTITLEDRTCRRSRNGES
jgi:hypothetical protein